MGSEKLTNGSAKLTKPFLYFSMSFLPSMIYGQTISRGWQELPQSDTYFVQLGERIKIEIVSICQTFTAPLQRHTSRQTIPVARAVVVAMAGMILPAICLVVWAVAGEIP